MRRLPVMLLIITSLVAAGCMGNDAATTIQSGSETHTPVDPTSADGRDAPAETFDALEKALEIVVITCEATVTRAALFTGIVPESDTAADDHAFLTCPFSTDDAGDLTRYAVVIVEATWPEGEGPLQIGFLEIVSDGCRLSTSNVANHVATEHCTVVRTDYAPPPLVASASAEEFAPYVDDGLRAVLRLDGVHVAADVVVTISLFTQAAVPEGYSALSEA